MSVFSSNDIAIFSHNIAILRYAMAQKKKDTPDLYKSDLFEMHQWKHPLLPFILHQSSKASNCPSGNWHDSLEMIFVTHGEGNILCDCRKHKLLSGDIVIINSGEVHRITTDSEMIYNCFIIGEAFCLENGVDIENLRFMTRIRDEKLWSFLDMIIEEWESDSPYSITSIRSAALSLLLHLCKNFVFEESTKKDRYQSDSIISSLEFINNNFRYNLYLDDVAKRAGMSKYHFVREFKRYTGHTVVRYINILRCEYAKRLLCSSDLSVGDIAISCGYENQSYFSKTFKTYTGVLPREFRANEINKGEASK